eukprot:TRINITY_DN5034_c0_g1_i7.p1 TRINITY_DN5034_c0_g1~~TRINITY_DN5034_c0_g1_i7.p1  ORF type:complete len:111 (-),score=22.29 TRINITY_DN5034_c0_g1_i7:24-356(-)
MFFKTSENLTFKKRYGFLFNDLLLITKHLVVERKFWIRFHVGLSRIRVVDVKPSRSRFGFMLLNPKMDLTLEFQTGEDKNIWKTEIEEAIRALDDKKDVLSNVLQNKIFE